jgi:heme O synthase-like polyprenyltransferase
MAVFIVVYAMLDVAHLDRYTRYTITPYVALIVAFSGILTRNIHLHNNNTALTLILLGAICMCCVIKLVVMATRHRSRPIFRYIAHEELTTSYGSTEFVQVTVS